MRQAFLLGLNFVRQFPLRSSAASLEAGLFDCGLRIVTAGPAIHTLVENGKIHDLLEVCLKELLIVLPGVTDPEITATQGHRRI